MFIKAFWYAFAKSVRVAALFGTLFLKALGDLQTRSVWL